jgi:hypothetical protein
VVVELLPLEMLCLARIPIVFLVDAGCPVGQLEYSGQAGAPGCDITYLDVKKVVFLDEVVAPSAVARYSMGNVVTRTESANGRPVVEVRSMVAAMIGPSFGAMLTLPVWRHLMARALPDKLLAGELCKPERARQPPPLSVMRGTSVQLADQLVQKVWRAASLTSEVSQRTLSFSEQWLAGFYRHLCTVYSGNTVEAKEALRVLVLQSLSSALPPLEGRVAWYPVGVREDKLVIFEVVDGAVPRAEGPRVSIPEQVRKYVAGFYQHRHNAPASQADRARFQGRLMAKLQEEEAAALVRLRRLAPAVISKLSTRWNTVALMQQQPEVSDADHPWENAVLETFQATYGRVQLQQQVDGMDLE